VARSYRVIEKGVESKANVCFTQATASFDTDRSQKPTEPNVDVPASRGKAMKVLVDHLH
jgi:hypothetical protein